MALDVKKRDRRRPTLAREIHATSGHTDASNGPAGRPGGMPRGCDLRFAMVGWAGLRRSPGLFLGKPRATVEQPSRLGAADGLQAGGI